MEQNAGQRMELQTEGTGRSPEMKETLMHTAASEEFRVVSMWRIQIWGGMR